MEREVIEKRQAGIDQAGTEASGNRGNAEKPEQTSSLPLLLKRGTPRHPLVGLADTQKITAAFDLKKKKLLCKNHTFQAKHTSDGDLEGAGDRMALQH